MPAVVYGQLAFTYDPQKLLRDVAVELNTTEESLIDAFGTGATSGANALADAINRWNARLYSALPEFGVTSSVVTLAAQASSVTLPTAMWAASLVKVRVYDTQLTVINDRNIRILPLEEFRGLPEAIRNGTIVSYAPDYVALSDNGQSLVVAPVPGAERSLTIFYRAKLDVVTAASLTSTTSIRLPVPDEVMDTYCKFIAVEIAQIRQMVEQATFLRQQIRYPFGELAPRLLIEQIQALTDTVDPQSMVYTTGGPFPPNRLTARPLGGAGMVSPFSPWGYIG